MLNIQKVLSILGIPIPYCNINNSGDYQINLTLFIAKLRLSTTDKIYDDGEASISKMLENRSLENSSDMPWLYVK